ncbi:MAG: hypothetical protein ACTIA6_06545 [Pseudoclavibacter sp.]
MKRWLLLAATSIVLIAGVWLVTPLLAPHLTWVSPVAFTVVIVLVGLGSRFVSSRNREERGERGSRSWSWRRSRQR